jgi:hypothetical protein
MASKRACRRDDPSPNYKRRERQFGKLIVERASAYVHRELCTGYEFVILINGSWATSGVF